MTYNLFRGAGIGALAYVANDNDTCSLLRCTFQVKFKDGLHATFSLQHTAHVHGSIDAQVFHFLYDADNLVPATTTCTTAKRTLALTESSHIARNQTPEVRALSLNLKTPCAILCPNVLACIAPQPSHELHFRRLVDLAKAIEITILFDWKWFQPKQIGPFLTVVSQPETFTGFRIDEKNLRGRRLEDWSVFSPTEQYVVESNEPPSYADVSRKRARHNESHGPPLTPPSKRILYVPEGSPTEKATTILSPSRPPSSTVDESPHPPHLLDTKSPQPSPANPPTIPPHLEATMRKMMHQLFPEMLAHFLTTKSTTTSPPPPTPPPKTSPTIPPSLHLPSPLHAFLSARTSSFCAKNLTPLIEDALYDAQYLRDAADDDFIAAIEDQKLDIQGRRHEALEELQADIERMVEEKFGKMEERVREWVEVVGEEVERGIGERVERVVGERVRLEGRWVGGEKGEGKGRRGGRTAGEWMRNRERGRVRML